MLIEPVDHGDRDAVAAWFSVLTTLDHEMWPDEPGWTLAEQWGIVHTAAAPGAALLLRDWVARADGEVVGAARLHLPQRDNPHHGGVLAMVLPGARRRGVGSRLLATLEEAARAAGRTVVDAEVQRAGRPDVAGDAFARRHGYREVHEDERRTLPVLPDAATLAALEAEAAAASRSYDVRAWHGPTPEDLLEARARLSERISRDAPSGGSSREGERWDAGRVRADDAKVQVMGRAALTAVAVERATGEVVGLTMITISVEGDPAEQAWQWDTVVEPAHRGHRLGLLLKTANGRALRAAYPACRRVRTWNSAGNGPMIAVNDRLGARVDGRMRTYERELSSRRTRTAVP